MAVEWGGKEMEGSFLQKYSLQSHFIAHRQRQRLDSIILGKGTQLPEDRGYCYYHGLPETSPSQNEIVGGGHRHGHLVRSL